MVYISQYELSEHIFHSAFEPKSIYPGKRIFICVECGNQLGSIDDIDLGKVDEDAVTFTITPTKGGEIQRLYPNMPKKKLSKLLANGLLKVDENSYLVTRKWTETNNFPSGAIVIGGETT